MFIGSLNEVTSSSKKKSYLSYEGMDTQASAEYYQSLLKFEKLDLSNCPPELYQKYKDYPAQPVITVDGQHGFRLRAELIVIDDKQRILFDPSSKVQGFTYDFPGGGLDKDEPVELAAKRECQEEALVTAKSVKFVNIAYKCMYHPVVISPGFVSLICVGLYKGPYKGYVKKIDRDEFVDKAVWKSYKRVDLKEPHKLAIERYMEMMM